MDPVNFLFSAVPSDILVQFRAGDAGVEDKSAIAVVIVRESDQQYLASSGIDMNKASLIPMLMCYGTKVVLALRNNGNVVGELVLGKQDSGQHFIGIEHPEVSGTWILTGEDVSSLRDLFCGEVA